MFERHLQSVLQRFSSQFRIIGITGPRQSGKTTLARHFFSDLPYISLENLDTRARAKADMRGFLNSHKSGAIFDEVQHLPELMSYLQGVVDDSNAMGRFVLTGSQNFSLSEQISQSLSGRIGMTTLLPLSLSEIGHSLSHTASIFQGGYPGLQQIHMNPLDFYPSYIQTYVERDVRQIKNIENFELFQNFLKLCAARVGQIINFSSLATDAGISPTTARQWLHILKASYIIFFLQPFYNNYNKRLIKMPKLYFYDTGLACNLLGLEKESQLETHYLKGALFENLIVLEILKLRINRGLPPNLYFWRDRSGQEVDLLGDWGGHIHAIEIKANATFQGSFIKSLKKFEALASNVKSYVIYTGNEEGDFQKVTLTPVHKISTMFD